MTIKISVMPAATMATITTVPVLDSAAVGGNARATPKQILDRALNNINANGGFGYAMMLNGGPLPGSSYLATNFSNDGSFVGECYFDWANNLFGWRPAVAGRDSMQTGSNGSTSYIHCRAPIQGSGGDPGTGFSYIAAAESSGVDAIWLKCDESNTVQSIGSNYYGDVFYFAFQASFAQIDPLASLNWDLNWASAQAGRPTAFIHLLHGQEKGAVVSWSASTYSLTAPGSNYYRFTGSVASVFTLPTADLVADAFSGVYGSVIIISNRGTAAVTVTARGTNTIEGLATLVIAAGQTKTFRAISTTAWDAY